MFATCQANAVQAVIQTRKEDNSDSSSPVTTSDHLVIIGGNLVFVSGNLVGRYPTPLCPFFFNTTTSSSLIFQVSLVRRPSLPAVGRHLQSSFHSRNLVANSRLSTPSRPLSSLSVIHEDGIDADGTAAGLAPALD